MNKTFGETLNNVIAVERMCESYYNLVKLGSDGFIDLNEMLTHVKSEIIFKQLGGHAKFNLEEVKIGINNFVRRKLENKECAFVDEKEYGKVVYTEFN